MKLTRYILFEKSYSFGRYSHPDNVPEIYWTNFEKLLNSSELSLSAILYLYVDIILAPLTKQNKYILSYPYIHGERVYFTITWENSSTLDMEMESDVNLIKKAEFIKDLTSKMWTYSYYFIPETPR